MKLIITLLTIIIISPTKLLAQVGIGTLNPHKTAILEINSSEKGFLPPRLTTSQRDSIVMPATGLLIYNYSLHCLETNIGLPTNPNWLNYCISKTSNGTSVLNNLVCTTNSGGELTKNQIVNNVTQTLTVDVIKIGNYSISTDTINGVSFSKSGVFTSTGTQNILLIGEGTPVNNGDFDYTLNTSPNCTFTRNVSSPLNILALASYSLGSNQHIKFNSQLLNSNYYSSTGVYNKISNFNIDVQNNVAFIDSKTVNELINDYDLISVGYKELNSSRALKIKQYVDAGGLLVALYDRNVGGHLNAQFSGVSPVVNIPSGLQTVNTNNNSILNGIFGDGRNSTITGAGSYGKFGINDIPTGSIILATNGNDYGIWTNDFGLGRALFFWDEGPFRNNNVNGNIDNQHEIALHNCLIYLFNKKY